MTIRKDGRAFSFNPDIHSFSIEYFIKYLFARDGELAHEPKDSEIVANCLTDNVI